MSDVTLLGLRPSTYVRTAQLVCANKGISYTLAPVNFRSDDYLNDHPFRKMPVLKHGDVNLYETLAIAIYLDEAFNGPALQPSQVVEKARMMQWISLTNDYIYKSMVGGCVSERFVKPMRGLEPDEVLIAATVPVIERQLAILNAGLESNAYLAGDTVTLADFFLAPIIVYFAATPEGATSLPRVAAVQEWVERMNATPQFQEINSLARPS